MMNLFHVLVLLSLVVFGTPPVAHSGEVKSTTPTSGLKNATPAEIKAFFDSADYAGLHRADGEFINDLFHGILQREPDSVGRKAWITALQRSPHDPQARVKAVEGFLKSPEYLGRHPATDAVVIRQKDTSRNPGNLLFNKTGVLVNDATAFPADRYSPLLKKAGVVWIALQIDNGGNVRSDNVASIERGWGDAWRAAGFKVGFWGAPRGVTQHGSQKAVVESTPLVQADAALAVKLTSKYHGDFYIADCEDGYQGYNPADPAPALNRVYADAFQTAAAAAGIGKIPRALSSMGRVALDMKPWIEDGWDAMPQAYWNSYAVYQPSLCVDFYVKDASWPIERVHPTIATYTGEGEKRTVSLQDYAVDLKTRATTGFSYYLPESYLGLNNDKAYEQLASIASAAVPNKPAR